MREPSGDESVFIEGNDLQHVLQVVTTIADSVGQGDLTGEERAAIEAAREVVAPARVALDARHVACLVARARRVELRAPDALTDDERFAVEALAQELSETDAGGSS